MENTAEKLNVQAIDLASQGQFTEAIACFMGAIRIDKENYILWFNLGLTYRDSGDFKAAKNALLTAHKLSPKSEEVLETLSLVCYADSNLADAYFWATRTLEVNPRNANIWNDIGVYAFAEAEYERAAQAFESAVTISPHYYDALFNLRDTYEELGNEIGVAECNIRLQEISRNRGTFYV